jgi:hypothetical protein
MTAPVGTGNETMKKAALSRSCCRIFNDGLFSFPSLNRIDDIADFPKPHGHASAIAGASQRGFRSGVLAPSTP